MALMPDPPGWDEHDDSYYDDEYLMREHPQVYDYAPYDEDRRHYDLVDAAVKSDGAIKPPTPSILYIAGYEKPFSVEEATIIKWLQYIYEHRPQYYNQPALPLTTVHDIVGDTEGLDEPSYSPS